MHVSEQLEIFEEIAEQASVRVNVGTRAGRRRFLSISPAMERTKLARPAPDSPVVMASQPEAIPEPEAPPPPAVPRVVTNRDELLDLIRTRRDQLGITHEGIDHLAGWASGLTSKLLCDPPIRGLGPQSLALVLEVLALGIARIEFIEDPAIVAKMSGRWVPRKRPKWKNTRGALLAARLLQKLPAPNEDNSDGKTPNDVSSAP